MMSIQYIVAALYRFTNFHDYKEWQSPLLNMALHHGVKGTLLIGAEGVNGTIAGPREGIDAVLQLLRKDSRFDGMEYKESISQKMPFLRMKVRLKKEIVTLGVPGINPEENRGTYVEPKHWNALISDPEVILIDTRNKYEIDIGTFKGAINPQTENFREFPDYVKKELDPKKHKKVAMVCTGGIRCEKSTVYLKSQGFENVYHLKGGILQYLEDVDKSETMWEGECFVFDNRVAVNHDLEVGSYDQCYGCRHPISEDDKKSKNYVRGVSCPYCFDNVSADHLKRVADRQMQMDLAKERNIAHIGPEAQKD